ncbi:hypothetical protein AM1_C0335 (plasmid) [Acaryochloris marina MBIC11017]|uniref:Uncharacterized protein n=1 Tax=Acaryochloris marina (strain MBIC 11017) TaxID=329726 RepID=A8ZN63_ACAM1|nr:hypothetical protein AM1_C0335 [Acaryochloris marina MBIC11017]
MHPSLNIALLKDGMSFQLEGEFLAHHWNLTSTDMEISKDQVHGLRSKPRNYPRFREVLIQAILPYSK